MDFAVTGWAAADALFMGDWVLGMQDEGVVHLCVGCGWACELAHALARARVCEVVVGAWALWTLLSLLMLSLWESGCLTCKIKVFHHLFLCTTCSSAVNHDEEHPTET